MKNYNKSLLIAVLISLVSLILLLMWRERSKSKLEFDNQLKVGDKVTLPDYVYGIDGRIIIIWFYLFFLILIARFVLMRSLYGIIFTVIIKIKLQLSA